MRIKDFLTILTSVLLMISVCAYLQYRSVNATTWSGTAWFINSNGYMATADHVVRGAKELTVMYNGNAYTAYVIARDKSRDVAIIKIFALATQPIPVYLTYKNNMKVGVLGYPSPNYLGYDLHLQTGTATFGGLSYTKLYLHGVSCPGNSGSPIIDNYGNSIGVLTFGYTSTTISEDAQCTRQGGGTAIKYLVDLAKENGIRIDTRTLDYWDTFGHWYKQYKTSVVMIYGES